MKQLLVVATYFL